MAAPAFQFKTKVDLMILLGRKAKDVNELLDGMKNVPDASIYCHTHRLLQRHRALSPEPPNDFAYWVTNVLNDEWLGEQLASIDMVQFQNIAGVRGKFTQILENYLHQRNNTTECPPGEEFHFMASQTFVFPTPFSSASLEEFREVLSRVGINTLRYHLFDAKMRLGKNENDFSAWLAVIGKTELARGIAQIDPYTQTLEGLRKRIIDMVRRHEQAG